MHREVLLAVTALIIAGCSRASGPVYEFRPADEPLRYQISDYGVLLVETPVGEQRATDSTKATIVLTIAGGSTDPRGVSVAFEALEMWAGGDFPKAHVEGGDLLGKSFTGVLSPDGSIEVTQPPEVPAEIMALANPADVFIHVLPPLPTGGDASLTSWPHKSSWKSDAALKTDNAYDGTASFAGDTTWNGTKARIIVSEGILTVTARGTPAGGPGEIEFTWSGRTVRRYVWDVGRGVMLAAATSVQGAGELEVKEMEMSMPIQFEGHADVRIAN